MTNRRTDPICPAMETYAERSDEIASLGVSEALYFLNWTMKRWESWMTGAVPIPADQQGVNRISLKVAISEARERRDVIMASSGLLTHA